MWPSVRCGLKYQQSVFVWNTRLPDPHRGSPYPAAGHLLTPPLNKTNTLTMKHLSHTHSHTLLPSHLVLSSPSLSTPTPTFIHRSFLCVLPVFLQQPRLIKLCFPWCFGGVTHSFQVTDHVRKYLATDPSRIIAFSRPWTSPRHLVTAVVLCWTIIA